MTLDFSSAGIFLVDMEDYLDVVLEGSPDDMDVLASTPATNHLFKSKIDPPEKVPGQSAAASLLSRLPIAMPIRVPSTDQYDDARN